MKTTNTIIAMLIMTASFNAQAKEQNTCGAPELPSALKQAPLKAPDTERAVLKIFAEGTQNYVCAKDKDGKHAWQFTGPDATLYGDDNQVVGRHGKSDKGPFWQFTGGDRFVGKKVGEAAAGLDKDGLPRIPNLLLERADGQGSGPFSKFSYVQRGETRGGIPSKDYDVCDESHLGQKIGVEYQANYYFYEQAAGSGRALSCNPKPAETAAVATKSVVTASSAIR